MADHLFIERAELADDEHNIDGVEHEVATRVNKRPDVQIAWRIEAGLAIEDSLAVAAHLKHGQQGESDAEK